MCGIVVIQGDEGDVKIKKLLKSIGHRGPDRKKRKFSEGAGSADVIARLVEKSITPADFEREKQVSDDIILRSPEDQYYYRIWREVMASHISPDLVGRTLDKTAAIKC